MLALLALTLAVVTVMLYRAPKVAKQTLFSMPVNSSGYYFLRATDAATIDVTLAFDYYHVCMYVLLVIVFPALHRAQLMDDVRRLEKKLSGD